MSASRIVVVDDEPDIRELVRDILVDEGYRVSVAADAEEARELADTFTPHLALLDIWMPGTDGVTLLQEWQESAAHNFPVIMISGHGTIETAVEATRLGAYDFVEKPLSLTKLLLTVRGALEQESRDEPGVATSELPAGELIGTSQAISELRTAAQRTALGSAPVLLYGEPGTGRRTTARLIHAHSARREADCTVFEVANLSAAEPVTALFGADGQWAAAAGGTLILHDLAELDRATQAQLAARLNASAAPGEPRVIGITRTPPAALVGNGPIRPDLLQRFAVRLGVPPLREHAEDVPELIAHVVDRLVEVHGLPYRHFPVSVQNRLRHHDWPDNVAGLETLIQRLLILGEGQEVTIDEVERALAATAQPEPPATALRLPLELPLREARDAFEKAYLEHQLEAVGGRIGDLAQRVGMERTHLYRKLKSLGIDYSRRRG